MTYFSRQMSRPRAGFGTSFSTRITTPNRNRSGGAIDLIPEAKLAVSTILKSAHGFYNCVYAQPSQKNNSNPDKSVGDYFFAFRNRGGSFFATNAWHKHQKPAVSQH